mgnify:CR=1 FL=1
MSHMSHKNINSIALSATLHCLTGCSIGEILGLARSKNPPLRHNVRAVGDAEPLGGLRAVSCEVRRCLSPFSLPLPHPLFDSIADPVLDSGQFVRLCPISIISPFA